ncbi:MAG: hypothetical protein MI741_00570 [Rhodospirillales bacterium]|nr:hypothetical protein [Rhodospirillales bacterium]
MLGLSIGKLIFTVAVVAAVFYGWKWVGRIQAQKAQVKGRAQQKTAGKQEENAAITDAVDMVQCPACGDYVPAKDARSCGREDCPYPG